MQSNNNNNVIYFDSFGAEHIPKEIKAFNNDDNNNKKNIATNIIRIDACDSIMCGHFYIGFVAVILVGKTLTEYTNLFSPNDFKKNDDIILDHFMSNI